jgi:hypothetical protein
MQYCNGSAWTTIAIGGACGAQGAFKNLKVTNSTVASPNSQMAVTADADCLYDGTTFTYVTSVNVTASTACSGSPNCIDSGSVAASTWYSVWIISNGSTTASLLSQAPTSPTMPTGYVYKARVGWVLTDSSKNFMRTMQLGRQAHYVIGATGNTLNMPIMASGVAGSTTTPTWVAVPTSAFIPPTASSVNLSVSYQSEFGLIIAPNTSYGSGTSTTNPPPFAPSADASGVSLYVRTQVVMPLESSSFYWASNAATDTIYCLGWEDNL